MKSKNYKYVKKETAKLVKQEGKKSSIKMGDALEFMGLLSDRLCKERGGLKLRNAIVEWGFERLDKQKAKRKAK